MAETQLLNYKISNDILEAIEKNLNELGVQLSDSKYISDCIMYLSDFYIANPSKATPWKDKRTQVAYLSYYLVLNYLRSLKLMIHIKHLGFLDEGIEKWVEFGSGNGALSLAAQEFSLLPKELNFIESSKLAVQQHKNIQNISNGNWFSNSSEVVMSGKQVSCFSYSLTEMDLIPSWALDSEAVVVLEPSTNQDSRKLLKWRQDLINKGFYIWGPCTHQGKCPLLINSEKDWCHDRLNPVYPSYFESLKKHMPIKLGSLAFSYILARKTKPPKDMSSLARVVGDPLKERGKQRQLICRNEDREFLSWFVKRQKVQNIDRGSLLELPKEIEKKSNELRPKDFLKIEY